MKTINKLIPCLALALVTGTAQSQLYEKKYTKGGTDSQQYSTVENVPGLSQGQILASSDFDPDGGSINTIVTRVDMSGNIQWQNSFRPNYHGLDDLMQINNHQVGFNPVDGDVIVVGQMNENVSGILNYYPAYTEFDLSTGAGTGDHYYFDANISSGTFNAIHTVMSGSDRGAYMVGYVRYKSGAYSPLLAKTGSAGDFSRVYDRPDKDDFRYYLDVDVDTKEGRVVCVGASNISGVVKGIVDVYNTSGTLLYKYQYDDINGRFASVKSVGPDRVVIGGSKQGLGYVMQIDVTTGQIHWSRSIGNSDIFFEASEVIEVEQDAEGRPVFMMMSESERLCYVARLHTNGLMDWMIEERVSTGFGDLEPQYDINKKDHLSMLTGLAGDAPYYSRLTFLDHTNGFYGCQREFEVEAYSDPENNMSVPAHTVTAFTLESSIVNGNSPPAVSEDVTDCCWLPGFNVIPWNHPWETTYFINQAIIDIEDPVNRPGYVYQWERRHVRDIETGEYDHSPPLSVSPAPFNHTITLDMLDLPGRGIGNLEAEENLVYVTGIAPDGCKGFDGDYVTITEDGKPVTRPDYSNAMHGNNLEHEKYFYCQDALGSTNRYLYQHEGDQLSSNGFTYLGTPQPVTINTPVNFLASTGTYTFQEEVVDTYKGAKVVQVNTDVLVDGCNPGCSSNTLNIIDWEMENGRMMYGISALNLNPRPKIVKFSFSLYLTNHLTLPDEHHLIKRYSMRKRSTNDPIIAYDFLIPVIDERYLDNYPSWASGSGTTHRLYLNVWYTTDNMYAYDIDCHRRFEITGSDIVHRLAPEAEIEEDNGTVEFGEVFSLYPNPSQGSFEISGMKHAASVEVVDMQGRVVLNRSFPKAAQDIVQFNLNEMPSGLYILKVQTLEGKVVSSKLIKE